MNSEISITFGNIWIIGSHKSLDLYSFFLSHNQIESVPASRNASVSISSPPHFHKYLPTSFVLFIQLVILARDKYGYFGLKWIDPLQIN